MGRERQVHSAVLRSMQLICVGEYH
uniref:Uncharacterized protein n=1 Tax=Solanum lycopersicum TaxID=4081 RepID=A0A3Q7IWF7_SOLLC